jgi:hypothetical protein
MMRCFVVSSEKEIADTANRMSAEGYRIAAISNAGLPPGKACLTYLPRSVFKTGAVSSPMRPIKAAMGTGPTPLTLSDEHQLDHPSPAPPPSLAPPADQAAASEPPAPPAASEAGG